MYALGVLLYFMLFGKPPYIYPNLFNPDDVELANVIKQGKLVLEDARKLKFIYIYKNYMIDTKISLEM